MNKKIILSSVLVFVLFLIMDHVLHNVLLAGLYAETASLWRGPGEMRGLLWIIIAVDLALAVLVTWLFAKGWETGKSWAGQGLRFGLVLGLLFSLPMGFSMYAIMPIPFSLGLGWFLGALTEFVIVGLTLAFLFRK